MGKAKQLFSNWKILLLLFCVVVSLVVIHPNPWIEGVTIRAVDSNTTASLAKIENPLAEGMPMSRERILSINNLPVKNIGDYYRIVNSIPVNTTVNIKTNRKVYSYRMQESGMGLSVYDTPKSNIQQGLDLVGGTRVILKPAPGQDYTDEQVELVANNIKERLNVYGLKDITVRTTPSMTDTVFIIVEIAGVSKEEVKSLIEKQGVFEAKIGDVLVFEGGDRDVTYVCDSPTCSGVAMREACAQSADMQEWSCPYEFSITISPHAADKFYNVTKDLDDVGGYLSENITLFLDGEFISSLNIDKVFKEEKQDGAVIKGHATGTSYSDAFNNAMKEMNKMQSILVTGNLPIILEEESYVFISPNLGQKFVANATLIGLITVLSVSVILFIRYRKLKYALPAVLTIFSELVIIFGVATLIRWNLDIAAIAGIIVAIGTGVDHFIIILDEQRLKSDEFADKKKKLKNAFFIIFGSYFTLGATMLFLFFAGAGLLKGFALTTLIGATTGVLIARPAFAAAIQILTSDDKED